MAVPLIWVQDDRGVPGGTPGSRMGLRCPWRLPMISPLDNSLLCPPGIATGPHDA